MDTTKKIGTQKKITYNGYNISYGTVNKNDCKAFYATLEGWFIPEVSIEDSIAATRRRMRKMMPMICRTYFDDATFILDYHYPTTNVCDRPGKPTYCEIEITVLADGKFKWDKDFIFEIENFASNAYDVLLSLDEHYSIQSTKKGTH